MAVYYVADCGYENQKNTRQSAISGINKAKYLASLLNSAGIKWNNICVSLSKKGNRGWRTIRSIGDFGENVIIGPALEYKSFIGERLAKVFQRLWIACFYVCNINSGDTIIEYHALYKLIPTFLLCKIKRITLILEVEEVFGVISPNMNSFKKKLELKVMQLADGYIFPNPTLYDYVNDKTKPYCVIEGNITLEKKVAEPISDGQIHVVYAGIINHDKGAKMIIDIASYLDSNYKFHIIGYGNDEDIKKLVENIKRYNSECTSSAKVVFDGLKTGLDYNLYLQKCHVGLCPQIVTTEYNDASFPSKISSYLSNGLRVVATSSNAIENSRLKDLIVTASYDPKSIAEAIKRIDYNKALPITETLLSLRQSQISDISALIHNTSERN